MMGLGEMGFNTGGGAINWFPGHMAAATRAIRDRLKLADFVIEVRDARIPLSSANQDLQPQLRAKRSLIVLNKKDLANTNIMQVMLTSTRFCFFFWCCYYQIVDEFRVCIGLIVVEMDSVFRIVQARLPSYKCT